jgi:hypothetical protein
MSLSTPDFGTSLAGRTNVLKLETYGDLSAATVDGALAGSEDAFALSFSARDPLESGIQTFSHPDLGVFEFFIAPVEGRGAYEVVVNRSVGAPKHVPHPKGTAASVSTTPKPADQHARAAHVRRLSARRLARGVVAEIALGSHADVKSATVWLSRGGLVVAATTVHHVHGHHIAARLAMKHRARGGRYELTVATRDRGGHTQYKRASITLQ